MVRVKNRYLLVDIVYPDVSLPAPKDGLPALVAFNHPTSDSLTPQVLLRAIRANALELFGDYGAGAIADSLQIKYLSPATSTVILRVARGYYRILWATLSFMDHIPVTNGSPCIFRVVRVSGTIRKAEEEAIRRTRDTILRARRAMGDEADAALQKLLGAGTANDQDIDMRDDSGNDDDETDNG